MFDGRTSEEVYGWRQKSGRHENHHGIPPNKRRQAVPRLGSTSIQRPSEGDWIAVATGSFDQPEEFRPTNVHCGIESQVPWLKINDDLPRKTTGEAMGYRRGDGLRS